MAQYLKLFNNDIDYDDYENGIDYIEPNVCYIVQTNKVIYNNGYEPFINSDNNSIVMDGNFFVKKK